MAEKGPTKGELRTLEEFNEALKIMETNAKSAAVANSQMASATKGTAQAVEYQNRAMKALIKGQQDQITLITKAMQANQGNQAALDSLSQELVNATKKLEEYNDKLEAQSTVNKAAADGLRDLKGMLGVNADATSNFVFQMAALTNKLATSEKKFLTMKNAMSAASAAMNTMSNYMEQAFLVILKKGWDIVVGINEAQAKFAQTIALTGNELDSYRSQISAVTYENLRAGTSADQVGEAYSSLYTTVTQFSRMSAQQQQAMGETVSLLMQTGTSAQDAAQSMQMLNKVMNQTGAQLSESVRQLQAFAQALRVPPAIVQRDFAEMSMDLAVYGDKMISVFQGLQVQAKNTGLSMNQLMQITGQFDTFSGAAEAAGRLNAVLGRDLFNSLDMLLTVDPTERFRKLREGILQAAGAFEEMEYYEKRAIASAAGLQGVGELALLMSGRLEQGSQAMGEQAMTAEQLADQQMTLMSLQQKWSATLARLAPQLESLMGMLIRLVDYVADNAEKWRSWAPIIAGVWVAMKVGAAIIPMIQTGLMAYTAATTAATTATTGLSLALTVGTGGAIALVAGLGMLAASLFKPQHSPDLLTGLGAMPSRMNRNASAARQMASGMEALGRAAAPVGGAVAGSLGALQQFGNIDTRNMNLVADAIRNIARALNQVDVNKSLEFRSSINTFASQQVSQVVNAAVKLTRDDVQMVSDLVEQANKLAVASTVSNGDELSSLVRAVAQIAQSSRAVASSVAAGGGGPENVEVTLKMAGSTLARQVVPIVNSEMRRQVKNAAG